MLSRIVATCYEQDLVPDDVHDLEINIEKNGKSGETGKANLRSSQPYDEKLNSHENEASGQDPLQEH